MAAYRCIALRRTGGLAAMRLEVEVDLTREEPGAAELARLLDALDLATLAPPPAPPAAGGGVPDGYHYDLTLAGEDGPHELAFDAGGVPAELRPVVRALERRALDELRARRSGAG